MSLPSSDKALVWFRRDLRLDDHAALSQALQAHEHVYCVFVFDTEILDKLPTRADRRVEFIDQCVRLLDKDLRPYGGELITLHGQAVELIPEIARTLGVACVYTNHDYEPSAIRRDDQVRASLDKAHIGFKTFKDQVIFEKNEILNGSGQPFKVFTAYKNAWMSRIDQASFKIHDTSTYRKRLARVKHPLRCQLKDWSLSDIGFEKTDLETLGYYPGEEGATRCWALFKKRIGEYKNTRDFPDLDSTSRLSVCLRFGTISVRELASYALEHSNDGSLTWLSELIWRDFYFMILFHRPDVEHHAYLKHYEKIAFENDPVKIDAWKNAKTGYPIVDAAMRQLNSTGFMHNRLRMVSASFLVKDLHVDWRIGQKYFAQKLMDYDLAANNGGWQWSASTGCDAQPYFRIFNPISQSERFDSQGAFIKKYIPKLAGFSAKHIHGPWLCAESVQAAAACKIGVDYPGPIVDHAHSREKTLQLFKVRPLS